LLSLDVSYCFYFGQAAEEHLKNPHPPKKEKIISEILGGHCPQSQNLEGAFAPSCPMAPPPMNG
jgi:hypothetical protein